MILSTKVAASQRRQPVAVNIVDGGIGINWLQWEGLEREEFRRFLADVLNAAGFPCRNTVRFSRNKNGRVDWYRLRIASDECQVNGVNPRDAVMRIRDFLASSQVQRRYGLTFEVLPIPLQGS